jgi:hypothetical protein
MTTSLDDSLMPQRDVRLDQLADALRRAAEQESREGAARACEAEAKTPAKEEPDAFGVAAFIVIAALAVGIWLVQTASGAEIGRASGSNPTQVLPRRG